MSTFIDRLLEEKSQLDERKGKLETFMGTQPFYDLPATQKRLLNTQFHIMSAYSCILFERLEELHKD